MEIWFLVSALIVAGAAAFFDWRTGHIPDLVSYIPLVLGPIAHAGLAWKLIPNCTTQDALMEGGISLAGIVICSVMPLLMFRKNALGGGDVKVFAALGALGQVSLGVEMQLYAFVLAAVIAPARIAYEGNLKRTLKNCGTLLTNAFLPPEKRKTIEADSVTWFRLGPCIFLGTLLTAILHYDEFIR